MLLWMYRHRFEVRHLARADLKPVPKEWENLLEEIVETYEEQVTHQKTEEPIYQAGAQWKDVLEKSKVDFYRPLFEKQMSSACFNIYNSFHNSGIWGLWDGAEPYRWDEQQYLYNFLRNTLDHEREWSVLYDTESEELAFPPHIRCPGMTRQYGSTSPAHF